MAFFKPFEEIAAMTNLWTYIHGKNILRCSINFRKAGMKLRWLSESVGDHVFLNHWGNSSEY